MIQSLLDITTSCKHKPLWYGLFWISLHPVNTSHYDTISSGYHYILYTQATMIQPLLDTRIACKYKPIWYSLFQVSEYPVRTCNYGTTVLDITTSCKHKERKTSQWAVHLPVKNVDHCTFTGHHYEAVSIKSVSFSLQLLEIYNYYTWCLINLHFTI